MASSRRDSQLGSPLPFLAFVLFGAASGGQETSAPTAEHETEAAETEDPTPSTAPTETAASGRFDAVRIDALGAPVDSPCRAHRVEAGLVRGGCRIVGPYPGTIEGQRGATSETYAEALDACAAAPDCAGIGSDWYTGSPWYPALGASGFSPNTDSYGCTLVLDCR